MNPVYCSKRHENPAGSRFCLHCGEKLDASVTQGIQGGTILSDRYVIIRQLAQGGFGKTYLAEDINRFRELCVLKEFAPQVQTTYVVQKAEELFEREASVLHKLEHPQIPRFRELFRINLDGKERLFLVQDYVEGPTYRSLLEMKKQKGLHFTEAEVRQLLQQILPVLDYIHSMGVIHRDISPDNLILRTTQVFPDQQEVRGIPVLIDFGGVKQVAAVVASRFYQSGESGVAKSSTPPTLLGKIGYAPPEQMQTGLVEPHSDLYALAATVLVLLTGKHPQELIDNHNLTWQWRREVSLSSNLGMVLDKMLSPTPSDRYQSAAQVLDSLNAPSVNQSAQLHTIPPTSITVGVSSSPSSSPSPPESPWKLGKILLIVLVSLAVGVGLWVTLTKLQSNSDKDSVSDFTPQPTPTSNTYLTKEPTEPLAKYSLLERQRKQRLRDRRQQLDINHNFYIKLINQVFRDKNPSLGRRTLRDSPADESLRAEQDKLSGELLEKLALLSSKARYQLGSYTAADLDRWKEEVSQLHVGKRSLYALANAEFFAEFPEQRGKNFINQPIGQVWQGFVYDKVNAILTGQVYQKIVFDKDATSTTVSGTLSNTEGKVFTVELAKNQLMNLKLQAEPTVLLSVYSPSGKTRFLESSTKRNLLVKLPEDGFYELVIVSTASEPVDYQISLTVEKLPTRPLPTSTSTATIKPTPTPTFSSTLTPSSTPTTEATPTPSSTPTTEATPTPSSTPTTEATPTPSSTPTTEATPEQ
jgi:serine/threonine-protein kinase